MKGSEASDLEVLTRLAAIRQHVRHGVIAPNKPLTLLWALGRVELEEPRLTPFATAEPELREWLGEYAGPKTAASYAFWRLQNDGIWEVVSSGDLPPRSGDKEPRITALREHAAGGFTEDLYARLVASPNLRHEATQLLERQIGWPQPKDPPSGPQRRFRTVRQQVRDARFRHRVMAVHGPRCAVCNLSLVPMLHAAHVRARSQGGPDAAGNGLPLCVFHHPLFDAGLFTWAEDRRLVVSPHWRDDLRGGMPSLHDFAGLRLRDPRRAELRVKERHLAWHRRRVFRG
jgi:putative restriction endonuclease